MKYKSEAKILPKQKTKLYKLVSNKKWNTTELRRWIRTARRILQKH